MNSKQRRKTNRKPTTRTAPPDGRAVATFALDVREADDDARTIGASLSSEQPIKRFFGTEILVHEKGAIDMTRAKRGLPLLFGHDQSDLLGRVRDISLDQDRVLRGVLHFSDSARADEKFREVKSGILTDISIGYRINKTETDEKQEIVRATNWTPFESSLVTIPADDSVGVNRNEDPPMEPNPTPAPAEDPPAPVNDELAIRQNFERFITREGVSDLQASVIAAKLTERSAMAKLLDHLGTAGDPDPSAAAGLVPGEDAKEKFHRAAELAILCRAGIASDEEKADNAGNHFSSYSLVELARQWATENGIDIAGMNAAGIVTRAIDPGTANLATTDFAAILENVMNKGLFRGFEGAAVTWNQWCSTGSVADFKAYTRPGLSQFTSLAVVAENAAIADGIMTDKKETGALLTYARKLSITREGIVNDDLSAFSENATRMGEAASRTIDEIVYAMLESGTLGVGPTMLEDATPLFDAVAHFNHVTALVGGTPPTEAAITVAKVAMARQVDQNSILVGIRPAFSLGPPELEETFQKLATAEFSPDGAANPFEPNSIRGTFQPITSARLADVAAWYMAGARGQTVEVNFLNGQASPSMERDSGWSTFALHWKVWIDADVLPLDWRAMYKDMGV